MSEPLMTALAGGAGVLLGAFFFGGLWWTVRKGLASPRPALWFIGSLLVRTGVVVLGLHRVSDGRWERLLAGLLGFVGARLLVTFFTRRRRDPGGPAAKEVRDAS